MEVTVRVKGKEIMRRKGLEGSEEDLDVNLSPTASQLSCP